MIGKDKSNRVPVSQSGPARARKRIAPMLCTEFQNRWDTWDTGTRRGQ